MFVSTTTKHRAIMKQTTTEIYKEFKMVRVQTTVGRKTATRTRYYQNGKEVTGHLRFVTEQSLFEASSFNEPEYECIDVVEK